MNVKVIIYKDIHLNSKEKLTKNSENQKATKYQHSTRRTFKKWPINSTVSWKLKYIGNVKHQRFRKKKTGHCNWEKM